MLEDFIFFSEKLFDQAIAARETTKVVSRMFINGKEFTDRVPAGTKSYFRDEEGAVVAANVADASESNPAFLITRKDEPCEDVIFCLFRDAVSGSPHWNTKNPFLSISVLRNSGNYNFEEKPFIQEGFSLVKITDREIGDKETIFMMWNCDNKAVRLYSSDESKKPEIDLYSRDYWDKCYQQRDFLDVDRVYLSLIYDCQKIYYETYETIEQETKKTKV